MSIGSITEDTELTHTYGEGTWLTWDITSKDSVFAFYGQVLATLEVEGELTYRIQGQNVNGSMISMMINEEDLISRNTRPYRESSFKNV